MSLQLRMVEKNIAACRNYADKFQDAIADSKFHYNTDAYRPFFTQLENTLAYIEQTRPFSPEDQTLQEHLAFLENGVSPLLFTLQMEASRNLRSDDEPGGREHNQRFNQDLHAKKGLLQGLNHMSTLAGSIEILLRQNRLSPPPTGGMSM